MSEKKAPTITRSERYIIDGREYSSLSEVPESDRKKLEEHSRLFEDKNNNGVPDIFEKGDAHTTISETKEVRVFTTENAGDPTEVLKTLLRDMPVSSSGTETPGEGHLNRALESMLLDHQKRERKRERIWYYVVIVGLLAVIGFLLLR